MRKRITTLGLFATLIVFGLSLGPVTPKAKALPGRVVYYTVHYICIIGPMPPDPIGYWVEDCDGNLTGWGSMPGDGCTSTTITYGDQCDSGGGHGN